MTDLNMDFMKQATKAIEKENKAIEKENKRRNDILKLSDKKETGTVLDNPIFIRQLLERIDEKKKLREVPIGEINDVLIWALNAQIEQILCIEGYNLHKGEEREK